MTTATGIAVIREGMYALSLIPSATLTGTRLEYKVDIQGAMECAPHVPFLDMILIAAGHPVDGLIIAGVTDQ